jgi:hypothetical protein
VFRTEPNWNRRLKLKIPRTCRRQLARPRAQPKPSHRLLAGVRLQAEPGRWFRLAHEVNLDAFFLGRQRLRQVVRLHPSSEQNQRPVDGRGPERQQCLLDQEVCRLHRLNGGDLNQVYDRSPV